MVLTALGPRVAGLDCARTIAAAVERHWREVGNTSSDPVYDDVKFWLKTSGRHAVRRIKKSPRTGLASAMRLLRNDSLFGRAGLVPGRNPIADVPRDAVYLNVSQFPLWIAPYFHWLRRRPDVTPVFLIHDLLPLRYPEFFPPAEYRRHNKRLEVLAQIKGRIIVTSEATATAVRQHAGKQGHTSLPICVAPLPADPIFASRSTTNDDVGQMNRYFVVCGTIEPRKNHLLLLNVWRELARLLGPATPKLVIVGPRGWGNDNAIDLIERCPAVRDHVLEVAGLSTPGLKRLLAGARALLMPSFAEGYGLPVVEALATGVPVILSDIEAFRHLDHADDADALIAA